MKYFGVLLISTLLVSCGGGGSSNSNSQQKQESLEEARGTYLASLRPLNSQLSGFIPSGQTQIKIDGEIFSVKSVLDDGASVTHRQNIHLGIRCPNAGDDSNQDGYVDAEEALRAVGGIIIPLDSDLQAQTAGTYPRGSEMTYTRQIDLDLLLRDLRDRDPNPNDSVVKLADGESFSLEGRVVLIHGANNSVSLPESVASMNGETRQVSMPIACGILRKF
jgi:hypothetical protein